jgi:hypothetical protein
MISGRTSALVFVMAVVCIAVGGCCDKPWEKYSSEKGAPDRSCQTGSLEGYDVYIWDCRSGHGQREREVVYQRSAEMSCDEPEKETAPCGEPTPIEEELGEEVGPDCEPVPSSLEWKVESSDGLFGVF